MSHDHSNLPDGQLPGDIEDPRGLSTWMIGICSIILFAVTCPAVAAMFYGAVHRETKRKVVSVRTQAAELMREARSLELEQDAHWETWTDADGELTGDRSLKIPMDQAVQLVIDEYGGGADQ